MLERAQAMWILRVAAAVVCLLMVSAAGAWGQEYLFAYFQEPGNQGIYLALSKDGFHFTTLNDGMPWVKPENQGEVMRDVFLTRGQNGQFLMVWTWSWRGQSLGYSWSRDLMHWAPQTEIPIMAGFPDTRNVWAPEVEWDAQAKKWMVMWSSSKKEEPQGNRIWFSLTSDFKSFSTPKILFDPEYEVIDATMYHGKKKQYLVFKDQTRDPLRYQVRYATGPTVEGPWSHISAPVTESWSEGPSVIKVGKEYVIYYDHYRAPHAQYEGVESTDWVHWTSVDDKMSFPEHSKHGSFLKITEAEAERLKARHDGAAK